MVLAAFSFPRGTPMLFDPGAKSAAQAASQPPFQPMQTASGSPAATAAVQGTPPSNNLYELRLSRSMQTHQGPTSFLKFREPIAEDFIAINRLPFSVVGSAEARRVDVDFALGAKWLSRLTGIDEIIIGQMHRSDFFAAIARVNEILIQDGADPGN